VNTVSANRVSRRVRLEKSPLAYVLCQVRMSAVMAIDRYVPEIQERLRKNGFPRFRKGFTQELTISPTAGPTATVSDRFDFLDKEEAWGVVLGTDFVTLHTSRYVHFENFDARLRDVLDTISAIAAPELAERVGIRYVNVIKPDAPTGISEYLEQGLLGYDGSRIGLKNWFSRSDFLGVSDFGNLIIRVSQRNDGQFLPPDLAPSGLTHSVQINAGEIVSLLDLDHAAVSPLTFDGDEISELVGHLHDVVNNAFLNAVTPAALEHWA
jgi:uncharacterized protein (TIGR04255 family)